MLKFIKHHMESIIGIELYPVISLLIFFIFFVVLLYVVFKTKKEHIRELSDMPLDDNEILTSTNKI